MFTPTNTVPLTSTAPVLLGACNIGTVAVDVSFMELDLSPSRRIWLKRIVDDELLPLLTYGLRVQCEQFGACGGTDSTVVQTFPNENGSLGAMATITVKINVRVSHDTIRQVTDTGTFARRLAEVIGLFMRPLSDEHLQQALAPNRYVVPAAKLEAYNLLPASWSDDYLVLKALRWLGSRFGQHR